MKINQAGEKMCSAKSTMYFSENKFYDGFWIVNNYFILRQEKNKLIECNRDSWRIPFQIASVARDALSSVGIGWMGPNWIFPLSILRLIPQWNCSNYQESPQCRNVIMNFRMKFGPGLTAMSTPKCCLFIDKHDPTSHFVKNEPSKPI